ncbi:hypothetical protein GOBAR_AA04134 [Gossypium barbadense]|uniref:Transcription elongation factor 1 homolog n=3 Tax=Gossypium TaxID=3633 RepID=A0A2P5YLH0_GOSBA|nr:hypothetical protein GOBAR_AA04134 [Gossypium barbadense]TYH30078.1 hypothetical protein ES288_A01G065000v1 [Gossypium darwinii]TYI42066.1 hypothetical protein ES332_A01G072200v1 [Gossypium tomentosum]
MGKRKSRAKPPPKKRMDKLDTVFSCPFCNHGTGVECRLDMKNLIGEAICRIVKKAFAPPLQILPFFSSGSAALTEPIDIYSELIDECEKVNNFEDHDS